MAQNIRHFIAKEKIYLLMIFFIIVCNLITGLSYKPVNQPVAETIAADISQDDLSALQERMREAFSSPEATKEFLSEHYLLGFALSMLSMCLIFGILAGLGILIWYGYARLHGRQPIPQTFKQTRVKWSFSDCLRVIITLFFFGYLFSIAQAWVRVLFSIGPLSEDVNGLLHTSLSDILIVAIAVYFVVRRYGHKLDTIGLSLKNTWKNVLTGVIGYIAALPILACVLFATMWVIEVTGYKPPMQPVVEMFLSQDSAKILIYMTVFVSIFGPMAEEIFFRGFLYKALRGRFGVKLPLVIVAALFALLHADVVAFAPILVLGITLGFLYERTGSLIASFTVHIMHNTATISVVFLIKRLMEIIN